MSVTVATGETDDPSFIDLVNHLTAQLISNFAPEEVWVIEVQNWFDHKWLRYSGKAVVDFPEVLGVGEFGALDAKWQEKLTFPPFSPHRGAEAVRVSTKRR
jgi:hypothetical protein